MISRVSPSRTASGDAESAPWQGASAIEQRAFIVADDLTGAADAAAAFARGGWSSGVLLGPAAASDLEVTAICTDSRGLSAADAALRVRQAIERQARIGSAPVRFQKIDSMLRGNVGAEIGAALEAWNASCVIVAPSLPSQGRVVEDGWLRVVSSDCATPQHLPALLERQGLGPCRLMTRRGESSAMTTELHSARASVRILVCDALTDTDLDCVVEAGRELDGVLWVGSSGLAGALARCAAGDRASESATHPTAAVSQVVLWIGSTHPVTIGQTARLLEAGAAKAVDVSDPVGAVRTLGRGGHLVVSIDPGQSDTAVARVVDVVLELAPAAGFVMSGGDTAARVCRALGSESFRICGEVEEGIPWGWLSSRRGQWPLVLKSGGFGSTDALRRAVALLTTRGSDG